MPKTIALPVYMLVCPDETLAVELGSIQNQGVPKLVQVYAEQKYLGYSHEKAIALMAKEIESSLGIKSDTVKRLLDTTVQRTKPVAIDVSIPIYLASKLDIIGDYTEILASLGYKLIKPKRHPLDEDDTKLVAGFMESSGRILKLLSKLERNPDGTVSVSVKISRLDVDLLNSLGVDVD
ncbi:MAG: hypothetical protein KKC75_05960 [Nanoarchaeota archaeon]|nr:hypothetical protein [Nanoarchaeota archaeon]MBU1946754.1 hypothetical protein [Nanoarchaeota archaeon]